MFFVLRWDGYFKLVKDNCWGVFFGVFIGWVFFKEKFVSEWVDIILFGKLCVSFGLNGNVNKDFVGNYIV